MAEPDDLYTLRQEFYVGNFQVRTTGSEEGIRNSVETTTTGSRPCQLGLLS